MSPEVPYMKSCSSISPYQGSEANFLLVSFFGEKTRILICALKRAELRSHMVDLISFCLQFPADSLLQLEAWKCALLKERFFLKVKK